MTCLHKWGMQEQIFWGAQPPGALGRGQKLSEEWGLGDGLPLAAHSSCTLQ